MEIAKREQKKSWMYGLGGALLGGAAGFGLGKLLCSQQDRECIAAHPAGQFSALGEELQDDRRG